MSSFRQPNFGFNKIIILAIKTFEFWYPFANHRISLGNFHMKQIF